MTEQTIDWQEEYRKATNKLQAKTLALELAEKDIKELKRFILERFKLWLYHIDKQTVNMLIEECKYLIESGEWQP